jgi:hypothetical protein
VRHRWKFRRHPTRQMPSELGTYNRGCGRRHRLGSHLRRRQRLYRRRGGVGSGRLLSRADRQRYRPGSHGRAGGWCRGGRRRRIRLDKRMFRIAGNPNDRYCEDDEKGDKQATADQHLRGNAPAHDCRPDTPGLQGTSRNAHVSSRRGGGLRRRWSVVCWVDPYGISHTHHLAGEDCWLPVTRPSPPTNLAAVR